MLEQDYKQVLQDKPEMVLVFQLVVEPSTLKQSWLPVLFSIQETEKFRATLMINDELWLFPSHSQIPIFYHAKSSKFFTSLPVECVEFLEYRQIDLKKVTIKD
jgi:hypothetical protein